MNVRHTRAPIDANQTHITSGESDVRQGGGYVLHTYPLPLPDARSHPFSLEHKTQTHNGA